jgi:hypothetical protein
MFSSPSRTARIEQVAIGSAFVGRGDETGLSAICGLTRGDDSGDIAATFHDQCFAVSSNGSATQWKSPIGFGLAIAKDSATAAQEAIGQCESMAGQGALPCVIRKSDCEGSAK